MGDDRSDDGDDKERKTHQGFATPSIDEGPSMGFDDKTVADPPRAAMAPKGPDESGELYLPPGTSTKHDDQPLVEIEVVHQHGPAPRMEQPAQTLEVWTQNRIYTMDPGNLCVAVTDRKSGREDDRHPFLGFKLVGGQHRDGETFELSYPYPRPGTEAVFEHPSSSRGNFSRTSTVTRVVLRMHVVTVAQQRVVPTWTDITKSEIAVPPDEPGDAI
jgi:hypothetical protein